MKVTLRFLKFKARTKLNSSLIIFCLVGLFLLLVENVVVVNSFDLLGTHRNAEYSSSLVILLTVSAYHTIVNGAVVPLETGAAASLLKLQSKQDGLQLQQEQRSPRKMGYISASLRTMGCLPKFFCAMDSRDQTWNDIAHLIKFAMLNDDPQIEHNENNLEDYFLSSMQGLQPFEPPSSSSSEEDSKEDDEYLAVEIQAGDTNLPAQQAPVSVSSSTTVSPTDLNLTKQEKYKREEALVDEMLANLDQAIENTKLNNDANLSNILSGLNKMFRFGRSMNETGNRDARAFSMKNNFLAQMKLAAKIRQMDAESDKYTEHCTSTFSLCPYTVQAMKTMIQKGREEAKLEADFINQFPKPPPLTPPPPPPPPAQYHKPPPLLIPPTPIMATKLPPIIYPRLPPFDHAMKEQFNPNLQSSNAPQDIYRQNVFRVQPSLQSTNSPGDIVKSFAPNKTEDNKFDFMEQRESAPTKNSIVQNFLSQSRSAISTDQEPNTPALQQVDNYVETGLVSASNINNHEPVSKDGDESEDASRRWQDDIGKFKPKLSNKTRYRVRSKGKRSRRSSTEMDDEDDEEENESWEYNGASEEDRENWPSRVLVPPPAPPPKNSPQADQREDQGTSSEEDSDELETKPNPTLSSMPKPPRPRPPMVDHAFKEVEEEWPNDDKDSSEEDDEEDDEDAAGEKPQKKQQKNTTQRPDNNVTTAPTTPPTPTSTVKSLFNDLHSESNILGQKLTHVEKNRPSWSIGGQKGETTTPVSLLGSVFGMSTKAGKTKRKKNNSPFHLVIKHALTSDKVTNVVGQNMGLAIPGSGSAEYDYTAMHNTQYNSGESLWKPPSYQKRGKRPGINWKTHGLRPSSNEYEWDAQKPVPNPATNGGDWAVQNYWNSQETAGAGSSYPYGGHSPNAQQLPLSSYDQSPTFGYHLYQQPYSSPQSLMSSNYQGQGPQHSLPPYSFPSSGHAAYNDPLSTFPYQQAQSPHFSSSLSPYPHQPMLSEPASQFPLDPASPFPSYYKRDVGVEGKEYETHGPKTTSFHINRRPKTKTNIGASTTSQKKLYQQSPGRPQMWHHTTTTTTTTIKPMVFRANHYGYNTQDKLYSGESNDHMKQAGSYEVAYDEPAPSQYSWETPDSNLRYSEEAGVIIPTKQHHHEEEELSKNYPLIHNVTPHPVVITTRQTSAPGVLNRARTYAQQRYHPNKPAHSSATRIMRQKKQPASLSSIHQRQEQPVSSQNSDSKMHNFQYNRAQNVNMQIASQQYNSAHNTKQNLGRSHLSPVPSFGSYYSLLTNSAPKPEARPATTKPLVHNSSARRASTTATRRRPGFTKVNTYSENGALQNRAIASFQKDPNLQTSQNDEVDINEIDESKRPLVMQQQQTLQLFIAQQLHQLAEQQLKMAQQIPLLSNKKQSKSSNHVNNNR